MTGNSNDYFEKLKDKIDDLGYSPDSITEEKLNQVKYFGDELERTDDKIGYVKEIEKGFQEEYGVDLDLNYFDLGIPLSDVIDSEVEELEIDISKENLKGEAFSLNDKLNRTINNYLSKIDPDKRVDELKELDEELRWNNEYSNYEGEDGLNAQDYGRILHGRNYDRVLMEPDKPLSDIEDVDRSAYKNIESKVEDKNQIEEMERELQKKEEEIEDLQYNDEEFRQKIEELTEEKENAKKEIEEMQTDLIKESKKDYQERKGNIELGEETSLEEVIGHKMGILEEYKGNPTEAWSNLQSYNEIAKREGVSNIPDVNFGMVYSAFVEEDEPSRLKGNALDWEIKDETTLITAFDYAEEYNDLEDRLIKEDDFDFGNGSSNAQKLASIGLAVGLALPLGYGLGQALTSDNIDMDVGGPDDNVLGPLLEKTTPLQANITQEDLNESVIDGAYADELPVNLSVGQLRGKTYFLDESNGTVYLPNMNIDAVNNYTHGDDVPINGSVEGDEANITFNQSDGELVVENGRINGTYEPVDMETAVLQFNELLNERGIEGSAKDRVPLLTPTVISGLIGLGGGYGIGKGVDKWEDIKSMEITKRDKEFAKSNKYQLLNLIANNARKSEGSAPNDSTTDKLTRELENLEKEIDSDSE